MLGLTELENELAAIETSIFLEGMRIESGLYYQNINEFAMICKDVTLDGRLIKKLKNFAYMRRNIYVERKFYGAILRENLRVRQKLAGESGTPFIDGLPEQAFEQKELEKAVEVEAGYQIALSDTRDMMGQVAKMDAISIEAADNVLRDLNGQLAGFDGATLLQSINSLRQSGDYIYNHCVDVAILNGLIARWLKLPQSDIDTVVKVGFLHDIGKLKVPPAILNKPGALTPEEYEIVKKHPIHSVEILINSGETDQKILESVRGHHEHVNGTGYPDGLAGDAIPLFARITALSDVYSAMVSKRSYRAEQSPFAILNEFSRERYSALDYNIVSVFLRNMPQEFVGKSVVLSNGEIAEVAYVNGRDLSYPMVRTANGLVNTGPELYCVSMRNPVSLFMNMAEQEK